MDFLQLWLKITVLIGGFPYSKSSVQILESTKYDKTDEETIHFQQTNYVKNSKLLMWSNCAISVFSIALVIIGVLLFNCDFYNHMQQTQIHSHAIWFCSIVNIIAMISIIINLVYKRHKLQELLNEIEKNNIIYPRKERKDYLYNFITIFSIFTCFIMSSNDISYSYYSNKDILISIIQYTIISLTNTIFTFALLSQICLIYGISKEISFIIKNIEIQIGNMEIIRFGDFEIDETKNKIESLHNKFLGVINLQNTLNACFYLPVIGIMTNGTIGFGFTVFCLTSLIINDNITILSFWCYMLSSLFLIVGLCLIPDTVLIQVKLHIF